MTTAEPKTDKPKREVKQDPIIEARRKWRDAETKLNNIAPRLAKLTGEHTKAEIEERKAHEAFNAIISESLKSNGKSS